MHGQMPQEIEVWYIIPALRRDLAKSLIKNFGLTQKAVAKAMNLTEAAVSQYLKAKRAKDVVFSEAILKEIKKSTKKIVKDNENLVPEMIRLCSLTTVKKVMCGLHRKQDENLPKKCGICFEELVKIK